MGIVGRFTRDKVSAKIWWPFAVLLLALFVLTFVGEDRLGDDPSLGAAEFPLSLITDATPHAWLGYQITAGVGFGLVFLLALLSLRSSRAPIGAGVKFYPESLPPSLAVIDAEEAEQLRELGTTARRRVGDLQGRVTSMETEKMALEGEVQRLLSAAEERGVVQPIPTSDEPVGLGGSGLIVVPEADDVIELPDGRGNEIGRPPEPASEQGSRDPSTFVASSVTSSPVADEPVAANVGAPPPDESPVDMLARMVDPVGGVDVTEADRVELRARLERTAALKKPGSKERREERERAEDPSESRLP
jgi:hypothetical protein